MKPFQYVQLWVEVHAEAARERARRVAEDLAAMARFMAEADAAEKEDGDAEDHEESERLRAEDRRRKRRW